MDDDDHEEGGVVMGSITLGGDWPQNVRKIRALSGSPTPPPEGGSNNADEKRLKKRAREGDNATYFALKGRN